MCTKCCAYEGASPFVRKCGSVAGARRGGGAKGRESVDARRNEMYYVGRGEGEGKAGKKPRKRNEMVARRKTWKDLYPFKGTDLCREVYPRGN